MKTNTAATKTKTMTTTECQPRRILGGGISLTSITTTEQATTKQKHQKQQKCQNSHNRQDRVFQNAVFALHLT